MNDLTVITDMLKARSIGYRVEPSGNEGCDVLVLDVGMEKIVGYSGFGATLLFNKEGNLSEIGIWE